MAMTSALAAAPKHVVLTVIDDLGYDDLGFRNNGQIDTPNFDALWAGGIELSSYYVQPSCSPTRAAILTGRKPLHTGINYWLPNVAAGLGLDEVTLADVLNRRNFSSHAVGKWHLGYHKTPYTPTFRGFESFYGYYEGSEDYFAHGTSDGLDLHDEPRPFCGPGCTTRPWGARGQYSTNLYSARAVDVIERHDASRGLFLYLAYQGVHGPRQAPESYVAPYAKRIADPVRRTFAGMVAALDEGLGNVTAALRARRMFDDTLFLVTTDNGGPTTECSTTGQSNWPYRGSKCSVWEGGTRGTFFLTWAGLPAGVRGGRFHGLAHAADLLPTIVSAVGSRLWPNETLPLDGIDLWDAWTTNGSSPRTSVYYGISQDGRGPAVRDAAGFKLILSAGGGGAGRWSPEQRPNGSSHTSMVGELGEVVEEEEGGPRRTLESQAEARAADGARGAVEETKQLTKQELLYHLPSDEGERAPLDLTKHASVVARLRTLAAYYEATKVPQVSGDPACPPFAPLPSAEGAWIGPWCDGW